MHNILMREIDYIEFLYRLIIFLKNAGNSLLRDILEAKKALPFIRDYKSHDGNHNF